jgi:hypothetical protein
MVGVPVALAQLVIQAGGPNIATPEQFLWERAGLDGFTLVPLAWNRLDLWRVCNPVAVGLALVGAWSMRADRRLLRAMFIGAGLFVVSLGPVLVPGPTPQSPLVTNPVYLSLHQWVPGFWRLAKPEVFFQPVWFLLLVGAGVGLRHIHATRRVAAVILGVLVLGVWWPIVRLHGPFPGLSAPIESALDPGWRERVFGLSVPAPALPDATGEQEGVASR